MDTLCDGLDGEIVETTVTGPVGSRVTSRYGYRQIRRDDYAQWNYIIGMDEENAYYMRRILGDDPDHKVHFLMEYTDRPDAKIEDPWYTRNFDLCASEITEGCRGLLEALRTVRL